MWRWLLMLTTFAGCKRVSVDLTGRPCDAEHRCSTDYACDLELGYCVPALLFADGARAYSDVVPRGDAVVGGDAVAGGDAALAGDSALQGDSVQPGDEALAADSASSGDAEPPSCDALYGAAPGYLLCSSDAVSCTFNVNTSAYAPDNHCTSACAAFGGVCFGAFDNLGPCEMGVTSDTCDTLRGSEMCVCSR